MNLVVEYKGKQYSVNKNTLASGAYQSEGLKATDEEIDNKVFDLYGLTEEERRIVMET